MIKQFEETVASGKSAQNTRPFYFVVVFWGERFRQYLVEYCLPSLLAPNNIPALTGGQNKFIFCTTSEDWAILSTSKIFLRLQKNVEPYHIEIPPAPVDKSGCEHMGVGHKLAAEMAYRDKAYAVFLTPDLMVSDGTVSALCKHASAGVKVVLTAALRFGEEPLFKNLKLLGLIPEQESEPLTISSRQMVKVGLQSFHSQSACYEWEASYFADFPCACWWHVPGEDGIVLHSLSWAPFLCDYEGIQNHDTKAFDTWTLDGDYVYRNFGNSQAVHVVTDSDEIMLLSWAPLADRPQSLDGNCIKGFPVVGDFIKAGILRTLLKMGIFDPLKQRIFFTPIRWHAKELTPAWREAEHNAEYVLRRYFWDFARDSLAASSARPGFVRRKLFWLPIDVVGRLWVAISHLYHSRDRLRQRFLMALKGDVTAQARIRRRIRWIWRIFRGTPIGNL